MLTGKLIVTGQDYALIPLHSYPISAGAIFTSDVVPVTCNPSPMDTVTAEIVPSNSPLYRFDLFIQWHVAGVREVVYTVEHDL